MRRTPPALIAVVTTTAALVLGFTTTTKAAVNPISPVIEDPQTGFEYQLLSNADWADSQTEAQALGGNLATISSQEQQNFVFNTFGGYGGQQRNLWIGLYDPTEDMNGGSHASNFVWVSGAPVTFTNWDAGEPNDTNDAEFWVAMYYPDYHNPGSWNDWDERTADPAGVPFYGVAEFVPEPATLLPMVCAASMFLYRRKRAC